MSCNPHVLPKSLGADFSFDYERGTAIKLTSTADGVIHGFVSRNPSQDDTIPFLELYDAKRVRRSMDNESSEYLGSIRIDAKKIVELSYQKCEPQHKKLPEMLCHTLLISTNPVFNKFLEKLKGLTSVALNFYGTFVGRDGDVGWITLYYENTLVCIDVLELPGIRTDFWRVLETQLFSNDKIEKVIYNARPMSDYLFHKKGIHLKNVVDLQVTEVYVQTMWKTAAEVKKMRKCNALQYQPLSSLLEKYMKQALPDEVNLVREFEEMDFSKNSPLMTRPLPNGKHCKYVAVDMKYVLALKKELFAVLLSKLSACTSAQLRLPVANNDQMEHQLKSPLVIPDVIWETLSIRNDDISCGSGHESIVEGVATSSGSSQHG